MESQRVGYNRVTITYTHRKKSTHVTLPLNSLPNSTLLCTFSSHKVPKVIQSPVSASPHPIPNPPTCDPWSHPAPSSSASSWNTSPLVKDLCLETACSESLLRKCCFVYLTLCYSPATFTSPHPSLPDSYKNPCTFELLLTISLYPHTGCIICQSPTRAQSFVDCFNS